MKTVLTGSVVALGTTIAHSSEAGESQEDIKTDKQCVMEAGLTEAEAECWAKTAAAAGAFFALPELHPEDAKEVSAAIHVLQNKLLSRPTYRKYLEVAKANFEARKKKK
jgi:hypothetical protein